jgi:hypothetical protein
MGMALSIIAPLTAPVLFVFIFVSLRAFSCAYRSMAYAMAPVKCEYEEMARYFMGGKRNAARGRR